MKTSTRSTDKIIFAIIGGFTIFIFILIFFVSSVEQKVARGSDIISYSVNDIDRPKVTVSQNFSDLGLMNVKDEKSASFTIENTGSKPLTLYKISSSCDCTFGQITIDGNKSPEFGMHSKGSWTGTLDPGKTALVSVIYRPSIMPVKGIVTRDVFLQTNDPQHSQLTFSIKAVVE